MQGSGLRELGLALTRYLGAAAHGSLPAPEPSWRAFFRTVAEATRVHFFAIPAGAALAGAAAARPIDEPWRVLLAVASAGLGWGGGQLLNDLLDIRADELDAPHRPAVRGALPAGPTLLVVTGLGVLVCSAVVLVHPAGYLLASTAALLLLCYGTARRVPLLGNLAHAALVGTAACIGAAAARPHLALSECLGSTWQRAALCGGWAALYLEANYEKDRRGDRAAGYVSLAHLLGVRWSAALRACCVLFLAWAALPSLTGYLERIAFAVSTLLVLVSAAPPLRASSETAALRGYRFAVHGANVGLLSLGTSVCPTLVLACMLASVALTERAFRRSGNP
ncbi:MAG: UbiA family prenyltransferase [Polyangiaceae bacterium]|nr:UbiA family prenyltransferase [Polyangiaceae bacterium]